MLTVYGLEEEQIEHMLEISAKTLTDNISTAKTALKNSDYEKLGALAHSIKGSLLNLGLDDEAQTALKIEINARENLKIDFKTHLSQLYENLEGLLEKD